MIAQLKAAGLATKVGAVLGAVATVIAALTAFTWSARALHDSISDRAYEAGRASAIAEQASAIEMARNEAREAERQRVANAQAARREAEKQASAARAARDQALEQMRQSNDEFKRCGASPFPDSVRAFPRRLREQAPGADPRPD